MHRKIVFMCLLAALGAQAKQAILPHTGQLSQKQKGFMDRVPREKHIKQNRIVALDKDLLKAAAFEVGLFGMPGVKATRQRTETADGVTIYIGKLAKGNLTGEYLFSFHEDDIFGKLTLGGESYSLRSLGDGAYVLEQWDPASLPECQNEGQ